jgi:cob(I)alamin adenosyltransferase
MKIYTGTGDSGKTSLFSGERIAKNDARIEAYGAVDELNSLIGAIAAFLPDVSESDEIREQLTKIQEDLFRVGAMLATTANSTASTYLKPIADKDGKWLEVQMDAMLSLLPELTVFILPGGHSSAAWSHVARTVCRRAERRMIPLLGQEYLSEENRDYLLTYINRLSDYLFVLARYCNLLAGVADRNWKN